MEIRESIHCLYLDHLPHRPSIIPLVVYIPVF
jgi:hypothetical protein